MRPAPCTVYFVEARVGEVWVPCGTGGPNDEEFLAFANRRKAEELCARIWEERELSGIMDVRIGRRVARSAVTKNGLQNA